MLTSDNVKSILRRISGIMRSATDSNSAGLLSFNGGATLDDMTIDLTDNTGMLPVKVMIAISATGTPDAMRYSTDDGSTWSVEANLTGSAQAIANGMTVTFAATTGHTLGTVWTVYTSPSYGNERLRDFMETVSDIEVLNDMVSSVYVAGKAQTTFIAKYKTESKAIVTALTSALDDSTLDTYLTDQSLLVNYDIVDNSLATVSPVNVIPPITVLGEYNFSGVDAGTWTAQNTIDVTTYGGGLVELYALSDITDAGTDGMVSITGIDFEGGAVNASAAVAFGGTINQYETVLLSTAYPQRFRSISAISVTGGADGQKFQIRTKEDWKPIL